jgi:hypothetical protein
MEEQFLSSTTKATRKSRVVRFARTNVPLNPLHCHCQVFNFSGRVCVHECGNVPCRPVYGALSKGLSYDIRHDIRDSGWEPCFCEYCQIALT